MYMYGTHKRQEVQNVGDANKLCAVVDTQNTLSKKTSQTQVQIIQEINGCLFSCNPLHIYWLLEFKPVFRNCFCWVYVYTFREKKHQPAGCLETQNIYDYSVFLSFIIRKILNEFQKRISDLDAFYYHLGVNERYSVGPLPSFDKPSGKVERLDRTRLRRFGNPASSVTNRTSRLVAGSRTIRDKFHKVSDPLPSVPSRTSSHD